MICSDSPSPLQYLTVHRMTPKIPYLSHIITGVICLLIGIFIGYKLNAPVAMPETKAPEIRLSDTTTVLERDPGGEVLEDIQIAAKKIGGRVTRTTQVKLKPKPIKNAPEGCECEEIELNVGTVDTGKGTRTVVTTDDAGIVGGVDNPIDPYIYRKDPKWQVGVIVPIDNPSGVGPTVARKVGPFHVGVAAVQTRQDGWTGFVTATINF